MFASGKSASVRKEDIERTGSDILRVHSHRNCNNMFFLNSCMLVSRYAGPRAVEGDCDPDD